MNKCNKCGSIIESKSKISKHNDYTDLGWKYRCTNKQCPNHRWHDRLCEVC